MSFDLTDAETTSGRSGVDPCSPNACMIVEDQALIGLSLQLYLADMGLEACEPLPSAAAALEWLVMNTPAMAILDYALKDGPCTTLIRILEERAIPFVIYSGYERSVSPAELQHVPWITKPCDREALLAALIHAAPARSERPSRAA
ncbi:response regulator [Microvirga massiliensis]|uniref:response regulator n=1 Tax=Microvirga massiliensis TaxID=1033741 RepID=UPI00065FECDF|nr:response regulator [Microvirga massiliensis]